MLIGLRNLFGKEVRKKILVLCVYGDVWFDVAPNELRVGIYFLTPIFFYVSNNY